MVKIALLNTNEDSNERAMADLSDDLSLKFVHSYLIEIWTFVFVCIFCFFCLAAHNLYLWWTILFRGNSYSRPTLLYTKWKRKRRAFWWYLSHLSILTTNNPVIVCICVFFLILMRENVNLMLKKMIFFIFKS